MLVVGIEKFSGKNGRDECDKLAHDQKDVFGTIPKSPVLRW
jgi:hypothetical protein